MDKLPLDVSRCLGRATLGPDEPPCTLRDTCRRYREMLSDEAGEYVPVMMLTDEGGQCELYMEAQLENLSHNVQKNIQGDI